MKASVMFEYMWACSCPNKRGPDRKAKAMQSANREALFMTVAPIFYCLFKVTVSTSPSVPIWEHALFRILSVPLSDRSPPCRRTEYGESSFRGESNVEREPVRFVPTRVLWIRCHAESNRSWTV